MGRVVSGTRDHITGALDVVSWAANSVETQYFVFPVRASANTIGIPVLWTDRHVLVAFTSDEYLQGTIS